MGVRALSASSWSLTFGFLVIVSDLYTSYTPGTVSELYTQALAALEQGHGAEAASLLVRALKQPGLRQDDQIQIRCSLAEAWLQQDDLRQATEALGRPPEGR